MIAPERIHPSDPAGLCEIADDLADRIGDLAAAVRTGDVPDVGMASRLDDARHLLVTVANLLAGKR